MLQGYIERVFSGYKKFTLEFVIGAIVFKTGTYNSCYKMFLFLQILRV